MTPRPDAVVIGAGIVGAACARALAREGLAVLVLERGIVGGGATAAGMGHIVVIDEPLAELELTLRSRRLWDAIAPELPVSGERVQCGTLWIATDDEEVAAARSKQQRLAARGVAAELLDAKATRALEPHLCDEVIGGLHVPEDGVVYPPPIAKWLLTDPRIMLRCDTAVRAVRDGEVELASGERIATCHVVVANGLQARDLLLDLPLRARKGHLVITERYLGLCRHQIVELGYIKNAHGNAKESVAFNVQPRPSGQILVGSSRQFDIDDPVVEPRMLDQVVSRALRFMPVLGNVKAIRAWTGFRAATPDGLPLIGPYPRLPSVLLATGHEGLGITTSLGTAELVVAHVTGSARGLDLGPYLPARFTVAEPGPLSP